MDGRSACSSHPPCRAPCGWNICFLLCCQGSRRKIALCSHLDGRNDSWSCPSCRAPCERNIWRLLLYCQETRRKIASRSRLDDRSACSSHPPCRAPCVPRKMRLSLAQRNHKLGTLRILGSHISEHTAAFQRLQRLACGGRCMMSSQESACAEPVGAKAAYGGDQLAQQGSRQRDGHADGLHSTIWRGGHLAS